MTIRSRGNPTKLGAITVDVISGASVFPSIFREFSILYIDRANGRVDTPTGTETVPSPGS